MTTKNTLKNKRYLENKGLNRIQFNIAEETKKMFMIATIHNNTNPSEVLRKFILKYNSTYYNKYEA